LISVSAVFLVSRVLIAKQIAEAIEAAQEGDILHS